MSWVVFSWGYLHDQLPWATILCSMLFLVSLKTLKHRLQANGQFYSFKFLKKQNYNPSWFWRVRLTISQGKPWRLSILLIKQDWTELLIWYYDSLEIKNIMYILQTQMAHVIYDQGNINSFIPRAFYSEYWVKCSEVKLVLWEKNDLF